ncbi:MAG: hypothetical protein IRY90_20720, partial [Actinomadura rubrobrunea]|nr:hypothetical protein [Actinomadura rubrobrunea]
MSGDSSVGGRASSSGAAPPPMPKFAVAARSALADPALRRDLRAAAGELR